jgi:hypothetical protein
MPLGISVGKYHLSDTRVGSVSMMTNKRDKNKRDKNKPKDGS